MSSNVVTAAVAGCGYWGPNLLRNLVGLADCRLKTICDLDSARLKHLRGLYPGVTTERDFDAVVADPEIDAVVIATPMHLHYAMAKAAIMAGKHCLIEKPMAGSAKECKELCRLAAEKGVRIMVGHTFLFSPPVRKIKQIIDSGDFGEVRYMSARRLNLGLFQKHFNVIWDLAPHDIAIITYLMGEFPCSVNCQGKANVTPGIEDVAHATYHFPRGGYASIHLSWLDPRKVREMAIVGTRRMAVYDDLEPLQKVKVFDMRVERPPHYDSFAEFQYAYHWGDMYAPYIKQEEPLKVECQHFLDCILRKVEPVSDGTYGTRVVQVLEATAESLKSGGIPVAIKDL
jgi:predicted dehydrogenase